MMFSLFAAAAMASSECSGTYVNSCTSCTFNGKCIWYKGSECITKDVASSEYRAHGASALKKMIDGSSKACGRSARGGGLWDDCEKDSDCDSGKCDYQYKECMPNAREVVPFEERSEDDKHRWGRSMCFTDCAKYNGQYDSIHCWQFQPCYDNCVTACIDGGAAVFDKKTASYDKHLLKYPEGTPKCWVKLPTGCSKALSETNEPKKWFIDPRSKNEGTCTSRINSAFNPHCSRSDAESIWAIEVQNTAYGNLDQGSGGRMRSVADADTFKAARDSACLDNCLANNPGSNWCWTMCEGRGGHRSVADARSLDDELISELELLVEEMENKGSRGTSNWCASRCGTRTGTKEVDVHNCNCSECAPGGRQNKAGRCGRSVGELEAPLL